MRSFSNRQPNRLLLRQDPRARHGKDAAHSLCAEGVLVVGDELEATYLPEAHRQNEIVIDVVAHTAFGYAGGGYQVICDSIIGLWFIDVFRAAPGTGGQAGRAGPLLVGPLPRSVDIECRIPDGQGYLLGSPDGGRSSVP
jgi:hypothetical protein